MKTYQVFFDTRNHKCACSASFVVAAASPGQAVSVATRLLRLCGEDPLQFKTPKTRLLTTEELLAMAG